MHSASWFEADGQNGATMRVILEGSWYFLTSLGKRDLTTTSGEREMRYARWRYSTTSTRFGGYAEKNLTG